MSSSSSSIVPFSSTPDRSHPPVMTWFVFPCLLALVIGSTWQLLGTNLPRPVASGATALFMIVALLTLERVFPYHREWNTRPDGLDLVLLVANRALDVTLIAGATLVAAWLASLSLPVVGQTWPRHLPVGVQLALGIGIAEVIRYVLHRASHFEGLLWRWHRLHHVPQRMYSLNGPRLHPMNYLWVAAAHALPAGLLGADLEITILIVNVTAFFVLFQHANVDLRFDGFNQIFATADVHRLHHASSGRDHPARGSNFSIVFIVIDRLLGTYEPPRRIRADEIGLSIGARPRELEASARG